MDAVHAAAGVHYAVDCMHCVGGASTCTVEIIEDVALGRSSGFGFAKYLGLW